MKKIILLIFLLFNFLAINNTLFCDEIRFNNWKIEYDNSSGRFVIFYQNIALNQKESPLSSFFSLKIDDEIYHLGQDVSVHTIEKRKEKIVFIYKVFAEFLVEVEISAGENPLVYDDKGVNVTFRIDNRKDMNQDISVRFLFDTVIGEEQLQGYHLSKDKKKEITSELKVNSDKIIFYPFFVQALTKTTYIHLCSWQRLEEEFNPKLRELLTFRDIRSGAWDPSIAFFYNFENHRKKASVIKYFFGTWEKPNRTYPRVKLYHPKEVTLTNKVVTLPIVVENNGDFNIDMFKINVSSPNFKTQLIKTGDNLLKSNKKHLVFRTGLVDESLKYLKGTIKSTVWTKGISHEQKFELNLKVIKPKAPIRKVVQDKEAKPILNITQVDHILDKLNLLLYFINKGIKDGISKEIFEKLKREIDEIEKPKHKSDKKS